MTKILCVLDGFGLAPQSPNNAAALAHMPHLKYVLKNYFWTTLNADGENVGQEAGPVGNSEVGHMNIGGLKLVPQLSYQITKSSQKAFEIDKKIAPDQLFDPKDFLKRKFANDNKTVHLIGLFSTGQIHSDLRHWAGAIETAGKAGAQKIVMHLISDGRDSDRQSLVETWEYFIKEFEAVVKPFEPKIFLGSLGGRFYAMDRDNNWERVIEGVSALVDFASLKDRDNTFGRQYEAELQKYSRTKDTSDLSAILYEEIQAELTILAQENYGVGRFDETITPSGFEYIKQNNTVWLLNFRTDRMKEMSQMLCDINDGFNLNLDILAMNDYCIGEEIYLNNELEVTREKTTHGYYPVFKNQAVVGTLAEYISNQGQSQLHIAETEKYNHVTYFMNGGQNKKWPGEDWAVIDSNKVDSHAQMPNMKAKEVTDYILDKGLNNYDYILVNYANPDMVGHTGDIKAATETMSFVDQQLGRLIEACQQGGHDLIITADHGNVEKVGEYTENDKNLTDTEHNANFVPLILMSEKTKLTEGNHDFVSALVQKAHELIQTNTSTPDTKDLKAVLNQKNQVDLDNNTWLTQAQIPTPILPLWYAGLLLVLV